MSRSIPASAGEPCGCMPVQSQNAVYPRECGGASGNSGYGRYAVGLSPRVRGSHVSWSRMLAEIRSIPASAGEPGGSRRAASRTWVYPRECGGACSGRSSGIANSGLSPRVRGSQGRQSRGDLQVGSIPASAGEPSIAVRDFCILRVYPRECGGAAYSLGSSSTHAGLSPRVRGSPRGRFKGRKGVGSIPASAGEPSVNAIRTWYRGVYPRECGGAD